MDDVVSIVTYVTTLDGLRDIHDVRTEFFSPPYPVSTLVQVAVLVEPDDGLPWQEHGPALEPERDGLCIAVGASWADLRASRHGVPGLALEARRMGPLNLRRHRRQLLARL